MQRHKGASVRIEHPVLDDDMRALVAERAARSRISIKSLFPGDCKYLGAFSEIRGDQAVAAFSGNDVIGVFLFRRNRREPFVLSYKQFVSLWGIVRGTWLWCLYHAVQQIQDSSDTYCNVVWVTPEWRAHGVGRQLYKALIDGTDGVVHSLVRRNAVRFHERCGFRKDPAPHRRFIAWVTGTVAMFVPSQSERIADLSA